MALEIAAGMDALLHDVKGLRVHPAQNILQGVDLILGQADAEHLHLVAGPAAPARPAGNAPVQLLHDVAGQLGVVLLGEDQQLYRNILPVDTVQKQAAQHIIYSGVDRGGGIEQEEAQGVQQRVEGNGEPAHGEAAALLAEIQPQDVQSAGGAAAGQHQSRGKARQDAAHHAAGEEVRNDRRGRRGNDRQKDRVADGADRRLPEKLPAQGLVGQQEQRNVHEKIQYTGQVEGQGERQLPLQKGTDHLAQAVGPAAVEALRHDEHVDGHAEQQAAQQTADQAQALVVHKLLIHGAILLFFNGNVSNTGRIRRWYVYGTCTVRI